MAGVRITSLPVAGALSQSAVTVVVAGGVNYQASLLKLVTGGLPVQTGNANQVLRTDGTNYAWSAGFTVTSAGVVTVAPTAGMPASGTALTVKTVNSQTGAAIAVTDPTGATQLAQIGPSSNVTLNSGGRFFTLQGTGGQFALTYLSNDYLRLDANNLQVLFPSGVGVGVGDVTAQGLSSTYQFMLGIGSNNRALPSAIVVQNVTAGISSNSPILGDVAFTQNLDLNGRSVILRAAVDSGTTDTGFFAVFTKAAGSGSAGATERFRITSTGGTVLTPSGTTTVGLTINTVASQTGEAIKVLASNGTTKNFTVAASGAVLVNVAPPATANFGLVSLGSGPFDGTTSGFFAGPGAGTLLAMNAASGFTGDLLRCQVAGAEAFRVTAVGVLNIIGAGVFYSLSFPVSVGGASATTGIQRGDTSLSTATYFNIGQNGASDAFRFDTNGTTWTSNNLLSVSNATATRFSVGFGGGVGITPAASTGSPTRSLTVTSAAHTALTASTEHTSVLVDLSATQQFAAGALATQRAMRILAPTYSFVSAPGNSTITTAATLSISGAPIAGTNATITNAYALNVETGKSLFGDVAFFAAGSQSAPSISFSIGPTLGIYAVGAGTGVLVSSNTAAFQWSNTSTRSFLPLLVGGACLAGDVSQFDGNTTGLAVVAGAAATTSYARFICGTQSTASVALTVKTIAAQTAAAVAVYASNGTTQNAVIMADGSAGFGGSTVSVGDVNGSALTVSAGGAIITAYRQTNGVGNGTGFQCVLNNASVTPVTYAYVSGLIVANTAGAESGALAFFTRNAGTVAERMRVDFNGKVGLNAGTSPAARLHAKEATLGQPVTKWESSAASGDNPALVSYQDKVLTTDATATVLHNWALADNTVYCVKARVVARRTGGAAGAAGDSGIWEGTIRARRTSGGGTVLGTVSTQFTEFDQGWPVAFAANGNGLDLKVTGAVNTSISWILAWSELSPLSS